MITDAATRMPVLELSIGDYVLAGGEVATMVMIEAITRLIPGVLGNPDSAGEDSFSGELTGLLEAPSYTRPPVYRGIPVPAVLTSGDHGAVAAYRRAESLRRTANNRPDLLTSSRLNRCFQVLGVGLAQWSGCHLPTSAELPWRPPGRVVNWPRSTPADTDEDTHEHP